MKQDRTSWHWPLLPMNAALGGLGTFVPLYILQLGGTVLDVGAAASAFNLALVPAALLWGHVTDAWGKRRALVVLSYVALLAIFSLFNLATSVSQIIGLYGLLGFVGAASSPSVSLLIMETSPKPEWARAFARVSVISTLGLTLGAAPGVFWASLFPPKAFFLLPVAFALAAAVLAYLLVPEPQMTFERRTLLHSPESIAHRLLHLPIFFPRFPTLLQFRMFFRALRSFLTQELPLLYLSLFFFFMAASLFFTSYTPFLKEHRVSDEGVFLASSFFTLVIASTFPFAGSFTQKRREDTVATIAFTLRAGAMAAASSLAALALQAQAVLYATFAIFLVMAASFTLANTSTSTLIFKTLRSGHQGELLGVNAAMTGLALFLGSSLSGFASFHYGYATTFLAASSIMVIATVTLRLFKAAPGVYT